MKILLLCDDQYHPGSIPEQGIQPLVAKGYQFDVIYNAKEFKPAMLPDYNVVILSKSDHTSQKDRTPWKTNHVQNALIKYVENGGGLLANHSGLVAGENGTTSKLDNLIGSKFIFHPAACKVTVQALKPHTITNNTEMFYEHDEHYLLQILADDIDVLAAAYSKPPFDKSNQDPRHYSESGFFAAAAYVRTQGKGRVCVLTPGHTTDVWRNLQFQRMLDNSLIWCSNKG